MQVQYPKKQPIRCWDTVNVEYPVRKFPATGVSSETIGHAWRGQPEVLKGPKTPLPAIKDYFHDYNVTRNLMQSQSTVDFGFKQPETKRFNKHTSCTENLYIYPPSKRLADRPPQCQAHGTTEMREAYTPPETPARLVTDKDQFKHPAFLPDAPQPIEPSFRKEIERLDTTHEGFEKYLDPYLTTNMLHHRPYTAEQLSRVSNTKDVVTYYTLSDVPMTRTPKTKHEDWWIPISTRPKSMYDRDKFKQDFREIRTHNRPRWVPGSFRTEVRDNFSSFLTKPEANIHNYEEDTRSYYIRSTGQLPTNKYVEHFTLLQGYKTENSIVGSGKPICTVFDQFIEKNKRLEMRERKLRSGRS